MERVSLPNDLAQKLKEVVEPALIAKIVLELQQNANKYAQVREYNKFVDDFEFLIHEGLAEQTENPVVEWITQLKYWTNTRSPKWEEINFGLSGRVIFYAYLKCLKVCDVLAMENELRNRSHLIKNDTSVVNNKATDLDLDSKPKLDQTDRVPTEEPNLKYFNAIQESLRRIEDANKQANDVSEKRYKEIPTAINMVTCTLEGLTKDHLILSENKLRELIGGIKDSESKKKITAVKKQNDDLLKENAALKQDVMHLKQKNKTLEGNNSTLLHNLNVMKNSKEKLEENAVSLNRQIDNLREQCNELAQKLRKEIEKQKEKAKLMKPVPPPKYIIHYRMSEKFILADEIVRCFTEIQTKSNYEFKPFEQDNITSCQLLINFESVDDRIREVEAKQALAQSLLGMTRNNCVWAFICFKPTEYQEATKITNSVQNLISGYTTKEGAFVQFYLTSEYRIDASRNDKAGNLLHYLSSKDKFEQQVLALLDIKKPALVPVVTPVEPEVRNLEPPTAQYTKPPQVMEQYVSATPSETHQLYASKGAKTLQLSIADDQRVLATIHIQPSIESSVHIQSSTTGTKTQSSITSSNIQSSTTSGSAHYRSSSVGGGEKSLQVSAARDEPSNVDNTAKPLDASDRAASEGFIFLEASVLPGSEKVKPLPSLSLNDIPDTLLELYQVLGEHYEEFAGKRIRVEAQEGPNWIKLESDSQVQALQSGYLPHVQFRVQIQ